jgi:hypothetical protein
MMVKAFSIKKSEFGIGRFSPSFISLSDRNNRVN